MMARLKSTSSIAMLACCAVAGMQAPVARAQSAAATEAGTASTDDDGTIVVTAQRRSENIQNVPIAIQAFSGKGLADRGISQVQDLQKAASNVTITSPLGQGAAPAISIRGIGLNDFNTNNSGPNGVYVDEFAVSSPNAQGLSFFDLERVEVLKGPQGTLYGRNASGGAINITTAKPTFDTQYTGRIAYSSFNSVDADAAIGGALSETLAARVSGMYRYSDGFMYNHFYNRRENGVNMGGVRGQLLWKPDASFNALLKVQYVRNASRAPMYKLFGAFKPGVTAGDILSASPESFNDLLCSPANILANKCFDLFGNNGFSDLTEGSYNNGNKKVRVSDFNTTLRMQYDFAGGMSLVSITGYNNNKRFHPENTDASQVNSLEIDYDTKSREFTQELRLSGNADRLNWVLGGFYINEKIRQNQPLSVLVDGDLLFGPGSFDGSAYIQQTMNRQKTESEAIFGQADFKATDKLTLTAGARYTWERKTFLANSSVRFQLGGLGNYGPAQFVNEVNPDPYTSKNFSWRLGVNYKVAPDFLLFATASTGYKAGGFNGGFLSQDVDDRKAQLAPFRDETVTAYEAGLKSQLFDRKVTFNISGFYNDYNNQQVSVLRGVPDATVPGGVRLVFTLANAQKARIYGLDADFSAKLADGLTVNAALGYIDAKFRRFISADADFSGNRLSLAPKLTATFGSDYKVAVGPGELGLQYGASYRSKQFFEPTNDPALIQSGYWLHNARISYSLADGKYEVAAFARNFSNKKYLIWNAALYNPFGAVTGTVGEPRFVGIELKIRN